MSSLRIDETDRIIEDLVQFIHGGAALRMVQGDRFLLLISPAKDETFVHQLQEAIERRAQPGGKFATTNRGGGFFKFLLPLPVFR